MCTLLKLDYAKFGVSNLFFQTLLKKNLWGVSLTLPYWYRKTKLVPQNVTAEWTALFIQIDTKLRSALRCQIQFDQFHSLSVLLWNFWINNQFIEHLVKQRTTCFMVIITEQTACQAKYFHALVTVVFTRDIILQLTPLAELKKKQLFIVSTVVKVW